MQRSRPPFRAEHVGSLIRPERLIKARAQAERAVRANERRFEVTFDHAAVGIGLSDLAGCRRSACSSLR